MSRPAYLLLPRPGLGPEQLDARLRGCGLRRVVELRRSHTQPRLLRWSDAADASAAASSSSVEYKEDHVLGQRQIYLSGPRAHELASLCAETWPCWSPAQALALSADAADPTTKVELLAPLAALIGDGAVALPEARAVLLGRLGDDTAAVRRAALLVCKRAAGAPGAALRAALLAEPQLDPVVRSELAAPSDPETPDALDAGADGPGAAAEPAALVVQVEEAQRSGDVARAELLLGQVLAIEPLDGAAYWARAQLRAAAGQAWPALVDVTTALALGRRQGVRLQQMQQLQSTLRAQLTAAAEPPPASVELQAVAQVRWLLRLGRLHECEEVAELLVTLPGRPPLWWLAVGLARRERGRPAGAVAALEAALADHPRFAAARFLLGECRRELGDLEGARRDFARLDPQPDERPPRPSLLDAYADELLDAQAPWEGREHAFGRVQLLRELGCATEALAITTRLLQREAPAADALLAHGILLAELARPIEALAALDAGILALKPEERLLTEPDPLGTLQLHRAYALTALSRRAEAASALRSAGRLDPERAAAVAIELFPDAPLELPAPAPGYASLRRLAQDELLQKGLAAFAAARPQPAAPEGTEPVRPAAASQSAATGYDPDAAEVIWAALRRQGAELLREALAALDAEADGAARRELLARARRGLAALWQLAPPEVMAHAAAVRAFVQETATALGVDEGAEDAAQAAAEPATR